jgi:pilus assembly protein Flp/PilA
MVDAIDHVSLRSCRRPCEGGDPTPAHGGGSSPPADPGNDGQNAAKNKSNCRVLLAILAPRHLLKGDERFNSRSHLPPYCRCDALHFARGRKEEVMRKFLARMLRDESGATAIEYGLIAALISVVIISAVTSVGHSLTSTFNSVANAL